MRSRDGTGVKLPRNRTVVSCGTRIVRGSRAGVGVFARLGLGGGD